MKKTINALCMLGLICLAPPALSGQDHCAGTPTEQVLNANNIRASFFPRGNKFTDGNDGRFLVPYPSANKVSSIFASSPWLGGFDGTGNLKMATETYASQTGQDFSVGPLNSIGLPIDSVCAYFDRSWSIFREDILAHQLDFWEDGKIDDTIASVFGWPARGNRFFSEFNGFELPEVNPVVGLADFEDANFNGIYEPDRGDHPVVRLALKEYIPDQILWMVFNDVDPGDAAGPAPMRFELQLTAFAFHCQEGSILNNTIFNRYKIINRSVQSLDSAFFGMWTDYDLGCPFDDFIGSDSLRSTEFVYNGDPVDGDVFSSCTSSPSVYPGIPPVQSVTWLSQPMHSFILDNQTSAAPLERFRLLNGRWPDDRPILAGGEGYVDTLSAPPTRFLFHGDPRDPEAWAANNVYPDAEGRDARTISSVYLGRLDPGAIRVVEMAYMFHHDPDLGHLDQITVMHRNVDSLLAHMHDLDQLCDPTPVCLEEPCVWPGDFNTDGIANHYDLLPWGVARDAQGPPRDGRINWRGHAAGDWTRNFPDGFNYKHGDANGDGRVDGIDLDLNEEHFGHVTPFYNEEAKYPPGPELVIISDTMTAIGEIRNIIVQTTLPIDNLCGLAFELDYDTSLFYFPIGSFNRIFVPANDFFAVFNPQTGHYLFDVAPVLLNGADAYAFVKTDHTALSLSPGFSFLNFRAGLRLKPGISPEEIPDQIVLRLKNLIAIDAEGNDLRIGSEPYVVQKYGTTGSDDISHSPPPVLFPNPGRNSFQINPSLSSGIQIYTLEGVLVKTVPAADAGTPVDITGLAGGLYLVKITDTGQVLKLIVL